MSTSSLARNPVEIKSSTSTLDCPPYLEENDIRVYKNGARLDSPEDYDISGTVVTFEVTLQNGDIVDIIRRTDRGSLGPAADRETRLLYLCQEAADALAVLGSMDDDSFLWTDNNDGDRAFTVFPDGDFEEDPNSANPGGFRSARFRFQTSTVAPGSTEPSKSLGWYSCYLANSAQPSTAKHSIYGLNVLMRTDAGFQGAKEQAGVALQVQTEIANTQRFGKAEALVVVAQHQAGANPDDPDEAGAGKLVGVQSSVFPRGRDSGAGDAGTGVISDPLAASYSYAANANGLFHGFCAYIAKSKEDEDDPDAKGSGWYNGFVADKKSIAARSFWHVDHFVVTNEDIGTQANPLFVNRMALGHDDPQAQVHVKYSSGVAVRLEDTKQNASASGQPAVGQLEFWGKGNVGATVAPKELARIGATLFAVTNGAETCQLVFRTTTTGTFAVVWNLGRGLYSQGATGGDKGVHTVNLGTTSSGGYYVAGTNVVLARRTGWTIPGGTALRSGYDANNPTLTEVAQTLKALIADLTAHGLIGA